MNEFDRRAARARALAGREPSSPELLAFVARLAAYQGEVAGRAPAGKATGERVLLAVPAFLDWLEGERSLPLAAEADRLRRLGPDRWRHLAAPRGAASGDNTDPPASFVVEALTQALAPRLPPASPGVAPDGDAAACPACGDLPVVGLLREEGQGARRTLVCGSCLSEWPYRRVRCPGCGEGAFDALPVFTAERFPHARVETCDRCRRYLKTLDLTKDGLADPVADDVASVALDLWARERGYTRLRANLLRL